jgi:hypothetical protein
MNFQEKVFIFIFDKNEDAEIGSYRRFSSTNGFASGGETSPIEIFVVNLNFRLRVKGSGGNPARTQSRRPL